jgi:hypothetical protein
MHETYSSEINLGYESSYINMYHSIDPLLWLLYAIFHFAMYNLLYEEKHILNESERCDIITNCLLISNHSVLYCTMNKSWFNILKYISTKCETLYQYYIQK